MPMLQDSASAAGTGVAFVDVTLLGIPSGSLLVAIVQQLTTGNRSFSATSFTSQINVATGDNTFRFNVGGGLTTNFRTSIVSLGNWDTGAPVAAVGSDVGASGTSIVLFGSGGVTVPAGGFVFGGSAPPAASWGTYTPATGLSTINNTTLIATVYGEYASSQASYTGTATTTIARTYVSAGIVIAPAPAASGAGSVLTSGRVLTHPNLFNGRVLV